MIVTVYDNDIPMKLLQSSDLAIKDTGEKTVDDQRVFKVTKSRYSENGKYITEDRIRGFVQDYENREEERRRGSSENSAEYHSTTSTSGLGPDDVNVSDQVNVNLR